MKIVKAGVPIPPPTWWINCYAACPVCGAILLLEEGDIVIADPDNTYVRCPTERCAKPIRLARQEAMAQVNSAATTAGRNFIDQNV